MSGGFEDFDIPEPMRSPRGRPSLVTTAAVILLVSGLLSLLTVALFRPSGGAAAVYAVLGVAELAGSALVFLLVPAGRPVGIALGALGLVIGVAAAASSPMSALVTLGLNGFVIYALAANGPAFRRG